VISNADMIKFLVKESLTPVLLRILSATIAAVQRAGLDASDGIDTFEECVAEAIRFVCEQEG
jgi:hypothetical protein